MSTAQILITLIIGATVAMFLWGRWRHDMVAAGALLASVIAGLVPADHAFGGFSHPAVITVACVLVLSSALQQSGAVDVLARRVLPASGGTTLTIAALTALAAVLSGVMNNVGALALLMPVAVQVACRHKLPPGRVLMPVAFSSSLGGMVTMIGTPPNLIVAGFRESIGSGSFAMFDYTPVGLAVAAVGVTFIAILGWRFVPGRKRTGAESFESGTYLTEARLNAGAKAVGMKLYEAEAALDSAGAQIVGLVRNDVRLTAPYPGRRLREGDILTIEADPSSLAAALSSLGLKLEEDKPSPKTEPEEAEEEGPGDEADEADEAGAAGAARETGTARVSKAVAEAKTRDKPDKKEVAKSADKDDDEPSEKKDEKEAEPQKRTRGEDVELIELAVLPHSSIAGRSATDIRLRNRYGINLLAISRQGRRSTVRLRTMLIRAGDVLLMQGSPEATAEFASHNGCVPLAQRDLRLPDKRKALLASVVMALAIGGAAFGLLPAAISFAIGMLALMALRVVPPRNAYDAIDWPVIVLLGALIPVAGALESSGMAGLIAAFLLDNLAQGNAVIALATILVCTMGLSDIMNNAATAAMMCPIAIGTATQLGVSADPFLMAVAVGASCAFLTPIGHQNNTLILGPGGFRFGDYWRLGLPLDMLVVTVAVPMLLLVWPL